MAASSRFNPRCKDCPRLAGFLADLRDTYPDYYNLPVAPFGDDAAGFLVVGLAPGMHGANATGRPFTGDFAGEILYQTLHRFGFASAPVSTHRDDQLRLTNCRITNAVKCLPPQNKPVAVEIRNCNRLLAREIAGLPASPVILALGTIAHNAVLRALGLKLSDWKFGHGNEHRLPDGQLLIDSYHCSRYNTNTRRLTPQMFDSVFMKIRQRLAEI